MADLLHVCRYKIIIKNKKLPPAGGPATINGRDDDSDFEEEHFINDLSSEVIIIIINTRLKPAFSRLGLELIVRPLYILGDGYIWGFSQRLPSRLWRSDSR